LGLPVGAGNSLCSDAEHAATRELKEMTIEAESRIDIARVNDCKGNRIAQAPVFVAVLFENLFGALFFLGRYRTTGS
jgi:hypothetical protein